ncbi:hypothetical protein PIB30_031601 [Stylosanthes scabra]|uniref:DNA ligase n=1 Tax=Stylosanthes scabra TaxID=79078 RepID=A0ABU6TE15_9FABA|nr:hypothetical protein [Stylosanthes scabra]
MDPESKPQTFNSTHLFLAATEATTHSEQLPPSLSLTTVPSTVPRSKFIPNTRFLVDAFRHADTAFSVSYFLSHFHSDHYTGLSHSWSRGIVFCSATTASLLQRILGVPERFVVSLPLRLPVEIDGAEVTLVDANHCPGAVQFLFKVPTKEEGKEFERYVHTGDFRFCSSMILEPAIVDFVGCDAVFLDTTYCNPKFVFPSQEESVDYVVSVVERVIGDCGGDAGGGGVLFLVATYVIGKEKILLELARRLKRKVHVDARKMEVLRVLGFGDSGVFTEDGSEMRTKDSFEIHLVPYSEHSNYEELREYVKFLKPKHVVPTVGLDVEKSDSKHADKMRKYFAGLVDEMANKHDFLKGFHRATGEASFLVEKDVDDSQKPGKNKEEGLKSSESDGEESKNPYVAASLLSSTGEPCTEGLTLLTDEEKEKMVEELSNCLPAWVTRSQMLELISIAGSNVVEAVSKFYECETEFHKQAFSCQTSSVSKCSSPNDIGSPSKAILNSSSTTKNIDVFPSQGSTKLTNLKHTVPIQVSPAKRNKSSGSKANKKAKVKAKSQSQLSDSKQSTITNFFSKVLPVKSSVAQSDRSELKIGENPKSENMSPADVGNLYKDEIDQFMQIINGEDSLKDYAITIIEKAKGDVNKALDIYYCNSGNLGENEISVQAECKTNSSIEKNCVLHELKGIPDTIVKSTHVSLPLEKYNPKEHACWKDGQPAPYLHLARTFSLLDDEKGKIKATSMLCNTFRSLLALSPADVLPAVYLCTNKIAADHENMELNIGGSIVTAALEEACGTNRSKIREMYNKFGDLGDVAQECRQTQRLLAPPTPLLIKDVFSALQKISVQTGNGSTSRKKGIIVRLMRSCREKEIKFLVRTLVRNLRIGAMLRTVLPALAQAVVMNASPTMQQERIADNLKEKLQVLSVEIVEAYNILPNLDVIVPSLMNKGIDFSVSSLSMVPGIPIKPMLAKITNGIPQALNLFQNKAFTCEYKYDGQRAQIHRLADGSIRVFSRKGDESTSRFPDLIDIIKESCKPVASTFIIDAEVVGIDRKNGFRIMSFQELSSRGRGSKDTLVTTESIKAIGFSSSLKTKISKGFVL